ncbi:MAG: MFS transporter [Clostridia bacterium]|nr:MFS transporter [Clostridia bacterium]
MQKRKGLLAASLFAAMVLLSMIFSLQGSLLNDMITHYALSDSAKGLPGTAASVGGVAALGLSFFLIGRIRKFSLLKIAVAICALALAVLCLRPSFAVFVLIWGAVGFGLGFIDTLMSACMSDLYRTEEKKATRMMCMLHMTYGLASMLAPVLSAVLISGGMPWYMMYAVGGAFGLALVIFMLAVIPAKTETVSASAGSVTARGIIRTIISGALPYFIASMFFHGYFLAGLNTWINRYIGVTLGSPIGDISLTFLFAGVMLSRFLFPFTGLRPEKYIRLACVLSAVFLLLAVLSGNGIAAAILTALSGLCFGAVIPCMLNLACEHTEGNTMLATTPMMLALYLGEAVAPPVIGAMESALSLHWGIVSCCAVMLITAVFCTTASARCEAKKLPAERR